MQHYELVKDKDNLHISRYFLLYSLSPPVVFLAFPVIYCSRIPFSNPESKEPTGNISSFYVCIK
jgi:hypothetical protein